MKFSEVRADHDNCAKQIIEQLLNDIFDKGFVIEQLKKHRMKLTNESYFQTCVKSWYSDLL